MHRAVVLDMDNTLYDESLYFEGVLRKFSMVSSVDCGSITRDDISAAIRDSTDVWGVLLKRVGAYTRQRQEEIFDIYQTIDIEIPLYRDAVEAIEMLKRKSIRFGILTNGPVEAQRNKARCLRLDDLCDTIVCARMFGKGLEKPHKSAFEAMSSCLNIPGERIVFVGDNPKTDFGGAREIGGHTVRLMRGIYGLLPSDGSVDTEIHSLMELDGML